MPGTVQGAGDTACSIHTLLLTEHMVWQGELVISMQLQGGQMQGCVEAESNFHPWGQRVEVGSMEGFLEAELSYLHFLTIFPTFTHLLQLDCLLTLLKYLNSLNVPSPTPHVYTHLFEGL